jgi:hypothetical protein
VDLSVVKCFEVSPLEADLSHRQTWNAARRYCHYDKGALVGPTAPRYFYANNTASL